MCDIIITNGSLLGAAAQVPAKRNLSAWDNEKTPSGMDVWIVIEAYEENGD